MSIELRGNVIGNESADLLKSQSMTLEPAVNNGGQGPEGVDKQQQITQLASDAISASVEALMTSEKGWLGRIIEFIRSVFGYVTPGSVTDLRQTTQVFVKTVRDQSNGANVDVDASVERFFSSFRKRVEVLNLQLDQVTTAAVASKLMKNAFEGSSELPAYENDALNLIEFRLNPPPVQPEPEPVVQDPIPDLVVKGFWTKRTVAVVTGAVLLSVAASAGYAYWAGYRSESLANLTTLIRGKVIDSINGSNVSFVNSEVDPASTATDPADGVVNAECLNC